MLTLPPDVDDDEAFERSFDFSEFSNLQEVDFQVGWVRGNLLWIPTALSTLKSATSPRLSAIELNFFCLLNTPRSMVEENAGNDLLRIADEVTRIEREFEGVVNVVVLRDTGFEATLDALNVRFHLCGVTDTSDPVDLF